MRNVMSLASKDGTQEQVATHRSSEQASASAVLRFIRGRRLRGVFIDVGAGVGRGTLYFANKCDASLVLAIEGNALVQSGFLANVRCNNRRGIPVWLHPSYISDVHAVYANRHTDRLFLSKVPLAETSEPFDAVLFDEVCIELPRIDFIHVNVNRHELEVLSSARDSLSRHRPEICVKTSPYDLSHLIKRLGDMGYILVRTFNSGHHYFVPVGRIGVQVNNVLRRWPWRLGESWRRFALALQLVFRERRAVKVCSPPEGWIEVM
jgi:FkbM family methyltransferase